MPAHCMQAAYILHASSSHVAVAAVFSYLVEAVDKRSKAQGATSGAALPQAGKPAAGGSSGGIHGGSDSSGAGQGVAAPNLVAPGGPRGPDAGVTALATTRESRGGPAPAAAPLGGGKLDLRARAGPARRRFLDCTVS